MIKLLDFTLNYQKFPTFTFVKGLRFGWKVENDDEQDKTEYRIKIFDESGETYDSGYRSGDGVGVLFDGLELESAKEYTAELTVISKKGFKAETQGKFYTELSELDIQAKWIKPEKYIDGWAPYIRKKFTLKKVKRALLYAVGLGLFEMSINGVSVTDGFFEPPQTNYNKEILYRVYDITQHLFSENVITAQLGEGFYSQNRAYRWENTTMRYGEPCFFAQINVEYENGENETIITDESWEYKYGPITLNNLYAGEIYDARLEIGLNEDDGWVKVIEDNTQKGKLVPCIMPPVRFVREIQTVDVYNATGTSDNLWIIDMGENFAGVAEFKIPSSPAGTQFVFRYAETVNEKGELDYRSCGGFANLCLQQDVYISKGNTETVIYRPRFTYHGFRYIEVSGYYDYNELCKAPEKDFAVGYAICTDFARTAHFECDNKEINDLYKISDRTFRSNFVGVPLDCPVRERCGWLGDAQILCEYGVINYDIASSYEKYMRDIRTQITTYGKCTNVAPGKRHCLEAVPLWGAAQVIIPYYLYLYYGDIKVVEDNLDLIKRWIDVQVEKSHNFIIKEGLGDWNPPCGNNGKGRMPVEHSSTLMFYEIAEKTEFLLKELGKDGSYYGELKDKIKTSFIESFYDKNKYTFGYIGTNAAALELKVYPQGDKENLLKSTVGLIKSGDYTITTGIYGNKKLIPVLCENNYSDIALQYLFGKNHASFGTMMADGATTVYEILSTKLIERDKTIGINSLNHPMHIGFMSFCQTHIAGIKPIKAGFKEFEISPCKITGIDFVNAIYESKYGKIAVKYALKENGEYKYILTIPYGTTCYFTPINGETLKLSCGEYVI